MVPLSLLLLAALHAEDEGAARGLLGLRIRSAEGGMRVVQVFPASGAEEAGLAEGDLLTEVDGRSLAGLKTQQAVDLLTGPPGSEARVVFDPFPPGGPTERRAVQRRLAPPAAPEGRSVMEPVEREANVLAGALRAGRAPAVDHAVQVWAAARDPGAAERAALRMLREADATGWNQVLPVAQREAFWGVLAASEPLRTWLQARPEPFRAGAALLLARHRASAPLVAPLLPEPAPSPRAAAALALATAVIGGDPTAVAAAGWTGADLWSAALGEQVLGPRAGDLAALELCLAGQGEPLQGRPARLPAEVAERLERTGMRLPWTPAGAPVPFGRIEATPIEPFKAKTLDGGVLDLSAHRGPLILTFWATWCGPCRQELPLLNALRSRFLERGLEVWALSTDRPKDQPGIAALWSELGVQLPVALAPAGLVQAWDVRSVPRTVVLDTEHRVVLDHQGFSEASFETLEGDIARLLDGELAGTRTLGELDWGEGGFALLGTGSLDERPLALLHGPEGGIWVATADRVVPLSLAEGRIGPRQDAGQPLPFPADLAAWADLDGDGTAELLLGDAKGGTLRASRPDGRALWTVRSAEPLGGLAVVRDRRGRPLVAALRAGTELSPPTPETPGPPDVPIATPRHRLDLFGADGTRAASVPLPAPALDLAWDEGSGHLAVVLADGSAWTLDEDLALRPLSLPLERVRGLDFAGSGDSTALYATSGLLRGLLAGRAPGGGTWRVGLAGGGDLLALDADGQARARLDLQREPLIAVGDLDGDEADEVLLWAPWFGLAALRPAP